MEKVAGIKPKAFEFYTDFLIESNGDRDFLRPCGTRLKISEMSWSRAFYSCREKGFLEMRTNLIQPILESF